MTRDERLADLAARIELVNELMRIANRLLRAATVALNQLDNQRTCTNST